MATSPSIAKGKSAPSRTQGVSKSSKGAKEANNKYENSWVFGVLKANSGETDGNLTTSQYLETLDRYLNGALKCIVENTRYLDVVVTGLIGWQEENYRRRVSLLSKRQFIEAAVSWVIKPRVDKVKTLASLRLDRGVALLACNSFLEECKDYEALSKLRVIESQEHLKIISETESRLLVPGGNLFHCLTLVRHLATLASEYRGEILSKYIRLSIMTAQRDYVQYFDCRISLNDMCGEYILASGRAIDKCDYEKGPLTTHIRNWFFTARKHCATRYDTGRRESVLPDESDSSRVSGDDDTKSASAELSVDAVDVSLMKLESPATIRFLAKLADPKGDVRKRLGIEEILSIREKKMLGSKNF